MTNDIEFAGVTEGGLVKKNEENYKVDATLVKKIIYSELDIIDTSETVSLSGNSITVFSERGGIITSIKIGNTELLYQEMFTETLFNLSKNVKGGVPYMFPNAGPLTDIDKKKSGFELPQHGTGRISKWKKIEFLDGYNYGQSYCFEKTEKFPFKGRVDNYIKISNDSVILVHHIYNLGEEELPISTGLHPYFRVPEDKKEKIEWKFLGGEDISSSVNIWANDGTITFENPGKPFEVYIPGLGTLKIEVSDGYKKFWVWSLPGKDFVCIEPVMNNEGGIVNNPIKVKPGKVKKDFMKISLMK